MVQMEEVGLNDREVIKQDSRNALNKIPFCFQSCNIISEKKNEIECLKLQLIKKCRLIWIARDLTKTE